MILPSVLLALALMGCGRKPSEVGERSVRTRGLTCTMDGVALAVAEGWSCYDTTHDGKSRGLGVIPSEFVSPGAFMVSQAALFEEGRSVNELKERLGQERDGLARKYLSLSAVKTDSFAKTSMVYVEGPSRKTVGAMRREGFVVFSGLYARFVEIVPKGSARRKEVDGMIGSLFRVE